MEKKGKNAINACGSSWVTTILWELSGAGSAGKFVIYSVQGRKCRTDRRGHGEWLLDTATRWVSDIPIRMLQAIGESARARMYQIPI